MFVFSGLIVIGLIIWLLVACMRAGEASAGAATAKTVPAVFASPSYMTNGSLYNSSTTPNYILYVSITYKGRLPHLVMPNISVIHVFCLV